MKRGSSASQRLFHEESGGGGCSGPRRGHPITSRSSPSCSHLILIQSCGEFGWISSFFFFLIYLNPGFDDCLPLKSSSFLSHQSAGLTSDRRQRLQHSQPPSALSTSNSLTADSIHLEIATASTSSFVCLKEAVNRGLKNSITSL